MLVLTVQPRQRVSNIFIYKSGSFRPWVVSCGSFRPGLFQPNFGGESIRPILVGRFRGHFGHESFRPWVVSAHVGVLLYISSLRPSI